MDLLESYQALSDEAEKLDSTVQHSLGETSTTKMELATLMQVPVTTVSLQQTNGRAVSTLLLISIEIPQAAYVMKTVSSTPTCTAAQLYSGD